MGKINFNLATIFIKNFKLKRSNNYNFHGLFHKFFIGTTFFMACCFLMRNQASAQIYAVNNYDGKTIRYLITSASTVEVTSGAYSGDIKIPATVIINNQNYDVTAVKEYAFAGLSGLTSVTVPGSVTDIGTYAFQDCSGLIEIFVKRDTPPAIGEDAFSGVQDIPVHVPCGKADNYRDWGEFSNIIADALPFDITMESNDSAMGTARVAQRNCGNNTAVIFAQASAGYRFKQWSDDKTDNPRTVTSQNYFVITAEFESNGNIALYRDSIILVKASGAGDGSSWDSAYPNLAGALEYAKTHASVKQIWVAAGTYYPSVGFADRDKAFILVTGVKLFGGFPATGNPEFADRDWSVYKTILSGDINFNNVIDNGDAYHVVICADVNNTASLDGFVITGGNAVGTNPIYVGSISIDRAFGGGIYINNSSLVITNVIITGNHARVFGGGIYNISSCPVMINVAITGNKADNGGGGIYNNVSYLVATDTVITNVTVSGNEANIGGGIYNFGSYPEFINSIIWGNGDNVYSTGTTLYSYSLVQGNGSSGTNIDVDPQFENDYRLHLLSPAVDAGNNDAYLAVRGIAGFDGEKDLGGEQRKKGRRIDIGAYENNIVPVITIDRQPADTTVTYDSIGNDASLSIKANVDPAYAGLSYQWYSSGMADTAGGLGIYSSTDENFLIPTDLKEGIYYYYVIVSTINADTVSRVAKVIVKAHQDALETVTVDTITETEIRLNAVLNAEYRINNGVWQDNPTFDNLVPNTHYTLFVRLKAAETKYASPPCDTIIATLKATLQGAVIIEGNAIYNQILSVDTSGLVTNVAGYRDFGTLEYQWKLDGNNITGATGSTFRIDSTRFIDGQISVMVTAANVYGSVVSNAITVSKAILVAADLRFVPNSATYDGSAKSVKIVTNTGVTGVGNIIAVKYDGSETLPSLPGEYPITVDVSDGDNYDAIEGLSLGVFIIGKGTLVPDNLTFTPDSATYDGLEKSITVAANDGINGIGDTITIKYDGSETKPVNADSYAVTVDISEGDNYLAATGLYLGNLVIAKASLEAYDLQFTPAGVTYDGQEHGVTVLATDKIVDSGIFTVKYNGIATLPITPGVYSITVDIAKSDNYTEANGLELGDFIIGKGILAAADLQFVPDSATYDGLEKNVTVSTNEGITGIGDTITVKYDGSETRPVNAGSYAVTVDVSAGDNYMAATNLSLGNFVIGKAVPVVADLRFIPDSVTYSGLEQGVEVSANEGVVGIGDTITVKYDSIETKPVNAGSYAVTVDVSAGDNYSEIKDLNLGNFVIRKASLAASDLQFAPAKVTYDGSAKSVTVSVQDIMIDTGTFIIKYNSSETLPVAAGVYAITVDVPESDNFAAVTGLSLGDFVIGKANLSAFDLWFTPDSTVYNGHEQSVTVLLRDGIVGAGNITVKYNKRETIPVVPGVYAVSVDVSAGDNYDAVTLSLGDFVVDKVARTIPAAPVLDRKTSTSVTLVSVSGAQYRNGTTGEWQDSPTFSGLAPSTEYIFYIRITEDGIYKTSPASPGLSVVTDEIPTYGISLSPSGNYTFVAEEYGYSAQATYSVVVKNIGNNPTGVLNISLNGTGSSAFALSKTVIDNLAARVSDNFTLVPNTGLAPGVYAATIIIIGSNEISASFDLSFTVTKASQAAPPMPVIANLTATRVTLNTISGAEYRNGNGEWQDSPIFDGLVPNTSYMFYARLKGNDVRETSPASDGLPVITEPVPNYGISLNASGNYTFATDTCSYSDQPEYGITISNAGNQPTGALTITLSGESSNRFILSTTNVADIAPGERAAFTVVPKTGLAAGTYIATVTINGSNGLSASFDVSFTVTKARQSVPAAPTLASKTSTGVTLNSITGAQYRIGTTGEWRDSPVFNGLNPDTEYTFYIRFKETGTHEASPASDALNVTTDDTPSYGISLIPAGDYAFVTAEYGYNSQPEYIVAISNTGNSPTGMLSISLSGEGSNGFVLSDNIIGNIAAGGAENFVLAPNTGLVPGVYLATVTVAGANSISARFELSFTVNKATHAAPPVPTRLNKTPTSITLNTIPGAEYRNGNGGWQDSPIFDGLTPGTSYIFYARIKGDDLRNTSPSSEGLITATDDTPNYGISLSPSGNYTFAADTCGYLAQPIHRVMVNNVGNQPTGELLITLGGADGNKFIVSVTNISSLASGVSDIFTVVPKTGFEAGTYLATVIISGTNNITAKFELSFTVNKARMSVPAIPTIASKTSTGVTLNAVSGAQYRNGITGAWQDSPAFNGLTPNTEYAFYIRMKETDTHEASPASDALSVITDDIPVYGIALLPSGNHTFSSVKYGYDAQTAYSVMISNIGNQPTGVMSISLSGEGSGGFTLSKTIINDIAVENYESFSLVPNTGLEPGVYLATVAVSGVNNISTSLDFSFTVNKALQTAPATPELAANTATSVTLNTVAGGEYRNGSGEWQDSPIFDGLAPGTSCTFYVRMKESLTHEASPASDGLPVVTEPVPSYGISLNPSGNHTFATDTCGYLEQPVYSVRINNVGNQPTGALSITLGGENSNRYALSPATVDNLDPDGSEVFTVVPKTGLESGMYTATVTVSGGNGLFASFELNFVVKKARKSAPLAPTLDHKTATSITLNAIVGAEYRNGNGEWQDSPVFENLIPHTTYAFYARFKETVTHEASPSSGSFSVATYDIGAELLMISINDEPFEVEDIIEYTAKCNEDRVYLDIKTTLTASSTVTVNGDIHESLNNAIRLETDVTNVKIRVVSEDGQESKLYELNIYRTLDANKVLFQRWDDVLAVNSNPENNGSHSNIEGVRWYRGDNENNVESEEWFIRLSGPTESYHALILLGDKWHRVCGAPEVRTLEKIIAYPNPVSAGDNLNLHLPALFTGGYMNVISLSGSTVARKLPLPDKNNVINISDWSPGIYLLNIVSPNGNSETVKIIVN
jgi:hypothetical protein